MVEEKTSSGVVSKLDSLYEFDREPIAESKLHSGRYFAGLFAGEHVAATEFVIGALFVSWGAGAADIIDPNHQHHRPVPVLHEVPGYEMDPVTVRVGLPVLASPEVAYNIEEMVRPYFVDPLRGRVRHSVLFLPS